MRNKTFDALLDKFKEVHDKKNSDYAEDGNPYSNFEIAASVAGITVYEDFLALIGTKIARLRELLKGKTPKNETIQDTFEDLAIYACIMAAYHIDKTTLKSKPLFVPDETTKMITDHNFIEGTDKYEGRCIKPNYSFNSVEYCLGLKDQHTMKVSKELIADHKFIPKTKDPNICRQLLGYNSATLTDIYCNRPKENHART